MGIGKGEQTNAHDEATSSRPFRERITATSSAVALVDALDKSKSSPTPARERGFSADRSIHGPGEAVRSSPLPRQGGGSRGYSNPDLCIRLRCVASPLWRARIFLRPFQSLCLRAIQDVYTLQFNYEPARSAPPPCSSPEPLPWGVGSPTAGRGLVGTWRLRPHPHEATARQVRSAVGGKIFQALWRKKDCAPFGCGGDTAGRGQRRKGDSSARACRLIPPKESQFSKFSIISRFLLFSSSSLWHPRTRSAVSIREDLHGKVAGRFRGNPTPAPRGQGRRRAPEPLSARHRSYLRPLSISTATRPPPHRLKKILNCRKGVLTWPDLSVHLRSIRPRLVLGCVSSITCRWSSTGNSSLDHPARIWLSIW